MVNFLISLEVRVTFRPSLSWIFAPSALLVRLEKCQKNSKVEKWGDRQYHLRCRWIPWHFQPTRCHLGEWCDVSRLSCFDPQTHLDFYLATEAMLLSGFKTTSSTSICINMIKCFPWYTMQLNSTSQEITIRSILLINAKMLSNQLFSFKVIGTRYTHSGFKLSKKLWNRFSDNNQN